MVGISTFHYTDDPNKVYEQSYMFAPDVSLSFSENEELECLRLYKGIKELARTPEMQLAKQQTIELHKSQGLKYVENNCPDFVDLDLLYKSCTGNNQVGQEIARPELDMDSLEPVFSIAIRINLEALRSRCFSHIGNLSHTKPNRSVECEPLHSRFYF